MAPVSSTTTLSLRMQTNWQPESKEVEDDCSFRFSGGSTAGEGSSLVNGAGSMAIDENEDRGAVFGGDGAEESALAKSGRLGHFGNK